MAHVHPTVRTHSLTKVFGTRRAVAGLTFDVQPGEVFALLGPNGAGKTTTIRLMLDLIRPSSGHIEIFGRDVREGGTDIRARMGYLPGDLRLYDRMTGRALVRFFGGVRGMSGPGQADRLADALDLDLDRRIGSLSRGTRQKIGLVQAFMHEPELLVLDEPTSGLDPIAQQVVHGLMRDAADAGRTVVLSSHQLGEVQQVADRVALVREGQLVVLDSVQGVRSRAVTRVRVSFADPAPHLPPLAGVRELDRGERSVTFALQGEIDPLLKALARHHVVALDSHEADLEDIFLALYTQEGTSHAAA